LCILLFFASVNFCVCNYTESDPQCSTNLPASEAVLENDVITMTCNVTYNGAWAPVIRWFDSTRNFTDDVVTLTTNDTVTSQLTLTAPAGFHGSQISCLTYFTGPVPPSFYDDYSRNVPSYNYTWTSPILIIHCKKGCNYRVMC